MTASPKKRQANRANALRSTGPRSEAGKRNASQNARVHGLSMPINTVLWGPQVDVILALIADENLASEQAKELAARILDYERNLQQEREAFAQTYLGVPTVPRQSMQLRALQHLNQYLAQPAFASERGLSAEVRAEKRGSQSAQRFLERSLRKQANHDALAAVRYRKRSSNQLIKALKSLAFSDAAV